MRVAAIQMQSTNEVRINLKTALSLLKQAHKENVSLAVLPEMFAMMAAVPDDRLSAAEKHGEGPIQTFLMEQAKALDMWIVGGTIPMVADGRRVIARSYVMAPNGQVAGYYDKIHLFDVNLDGKERYRESDAYQAGHYPVAVNLPTGQLGLGVCYDIRFPEMFRQMMSETLLSIAIPAAFTKKTGKAHWEVLLRARAIENLSYVIAANQTGKMPYGGACYGHSMIIDPWGTVLQEMGDAPGVIVADIDMDAQKTMRAQFPALSHRRIR